MTETARIYPVHPAHPVQESSAWNLTRCSDEMVRSTVEHNHYLHRWPDARALPFAYILSAGGRKLASDGRPFGIVVFKKLQHHAQRNLFGYPGLPTAWQVLDLARVWVHPSLQDCTWKGLNRRGQLAEHNLNIFSRMVSLALKVVQRDWLAHHPPVYPDLPYHITLILSYCDRQHHQGTGYRASGFTYHGETSDRTKDIYIRHLKQPRWQWNGALPL